MTDRFWLWLYRYAARKAQRVYVRKPKNASNYALGVAAGKTSWERAVARKQAALIPSPSTRTPDAGVGR